MDGRHDAGFLNFSGAVWTGPYYFIKFFIGLDDVEISV